MATDQEYKYEEISVQVESKGELFEAKGKKILQYGWKLYEECFKNDQGMAMEEFCASEKEFPEEEQFYQDKSNASENKARKLEEIMDELEQGVQSILTSENYMNYLKFLSSFHSYSLNNTILIYHQKPDASLVAGYRKWQSLGRQVRKGEKGIKIIAPAPVKVMTERQKIDSETGEPVKDENGNPVTEEASTTIPRFKVYEG